MTISAVAAVVFAVLFAVLLMVQLSAAVGAPVGAYMWGGQHEGRLPVRLRIGSAASVVVYLVLVFVILDRAGLLAVLPESLSIVLAWITFGFLALGTVMNAISRSRKERAVMTPLAALLAIAALIVALGW